MKKLLATFLGLCLLAPALGYGQSTSTQFFRDATVANVSKFGAAGDGTTDDSAEIAAALATLGTGGKLVGDPGKTYAISRTITVSTKNLTVEGMSFKRATTPTTTTTATLASGATTIQVNSTTGFLVGDRVAVLHAASGDSGKGNNDIHGSLLLIITNLTATQITVSNGVTIAPSAGADFPTGSKVIRVNAFFSFDHAGNDLGRPRFIGCTFDGNRSGNDHTYSWLVNNVATFASADVEHVTVRDCYILNNPGESFVGPSSATLDNIQISSLYGSLYHVSEAAAVADQQVLVQNVTGNGICLSTINGHNEGIITYSVNSFNAILDRCTITNGGTSILGPLDVDDDRITISNSRFETFVDIATVGKTSGLAKGVFVLNNQFYNCGDLKIEGSQVEKGLAVENIRVNGNRFSGNSRVYMRDVADVEFCDNRFYFTDAYNFGALLGLDGGAVEFGMFDRVTVRNLRIEGPPTFNTHIPYGLVMRVDNSPIRKDAAAANINLLYPSQVTVDGVHLFNFRRGFSTSPASSSVTYTRAVQGWRINNIEVHGSPPRYPPFGPTPLGGYA